MYIDFAAFLQRLWKALVQLPATIRCSCRLGRATLLIYIYMFAYVVNESRARAVMCDKLLEG